MFEVVFKSIHELSSPVLRNVQARLESDKSDSAYCIQYNSTIDIPSTGCTFSKLSALTNEWHWFRCTEFVTQTHLTSDSGSHSVHKIWTTNIYTDKFDVYTITRYIYRTIRGLWTVHGVGWCATSIECISITITLQEFQISIENRMAQRKVTQKNYWIIAFGEAKSPNTE